MGNQELNGAHGSHASGEAARDPLVGRVFGDNYEIEELIAVGGMGRVYRATQRALQRTVSVKVIHPHLLEDEDTVARFYTEARAASSLNHPNSVSIFDFGRTDDGMLYLVMEFLRGRDLAAVIQDTGLLAIERIVDVASGVLAALGEAHARGVIHCDLKPENIILESTRSGADLVKVVDFGLAKIRGAEPTGGEADGLVSGTPDYMSPEQARANEVDGRGDLYALGVVLFELLTGRLPFRGKNAAEVMTAHVMDEPPHPNELAPGRGISATLAAVVLRALSKAPEERYADADDMARALRDAMPRRPAGQVTRCAVCGAESEARRKFCGECGSRLRGAEPQTVPSLLSIPPDQRSLLGRDTEWAQLEALRIADREPRLGYLFGPPGVGKTRLLAALAVQAQSEGDVVAFAGSHPSGTPVPYAHLRALVATLLSVKEADLGEAAPRFASPLEQAGLAELLSPNGLSGLPGEPRHEAVAVALARAVSLAAERAGTGRVLLLVDDLDCGDGLTPRVIESVLKRLGGTDVVILAAAATGQWLASGACALRLSLAGLHQALSLHFVRAGVSLPELPEGGFAPLLADHLRALRWQPSEAEPVAPPLADVVARRVDELGASARRLLQTLAVLGERTPFELARNMLAFQDMGCLPVLSEAGLASHDGEFVTLSHPFVRELVRSSIPVEIRCSIHRRALERLAARGAPLEERADHAVRAGETMTALMLLERMGVDALSRGDTRSAVQAFQRALELARRQLLETGDVTLDNAIATFSRRLGEALLAGGDAPQAAGVVREAIEVVYGDPGARAAMLCVLCDVAVQRDRLQEAARHLELARELLGGSTDSELRVQLEVAQARLAAAHGDPRGAVDALLAAWHLVTEGGQLPPRHAPLGLQLGQRLLQLGDLPAARSPLELTRSVAEARGADALAARAHGALGELEALSGARERAAIHYEAARDLAARAGDVSALGWLSHAAPA